MLTAALIVGGIGLVACVVAVGLLHVGRQAQRRAATMQAVPTTSAAAVADLPVGAPVEVKGLLRCEAPLTSEFAERSCAYYSASATREYEETERAADGTRRTERRSETMASSIRSTPFWVEDASGRVRVDPERAEVDAMPVFDRFQEGEQSSVSLTLKGASLSFSGPRETLGVRYSESVLPLDAPVYVLGAVSEDRSIGAPREGSGGKFLVSYRSEEALEQGALAEARWMRIGGTFTLAVGAILVAIAILIQLL